MRNYIMAAIAVAALAGGTVARADEFNGQQDQGGPSAYLDQQATNSQFADPTAPDSLRSHGKP